MRLPTPAYLTNYTARALNSCIYHVWKRFSFTALTFTRQNEILVLNNSKSVYLVLGILLHKL